MKIAVYLRNSVSKGCSIREIVSVVVLQRKTVSIKDAVLQRETLSVKVAVLQSETLSAKVDILRTFQVKVKDYTEKHCQSLYRIREINIVS